MQHNQISGQGVQIVHFLGSTDCLQHNMPYLGSVQHFGMIYHKTYALSIVIRALENPLRSSCSIETLKFIPFLLTNNPSVKLNCMYGVYMLMSICVSMYCSFKHHLCMPCYAYVSALSFMLIWISVCLVSPCSPLL